jgi:hypothetical protein
MLEIVANDMAAKTARMATTTSTSVRVNPGPSAGQFLPVD